LVYLVVALAPLVFAARLWPVLRGVAHKLLSLLAALVLSKLVMAVALAVAASAGVGAGSGGEVTALPEPEVMAEDPGGSVTQAVGILLAAACAFGVAAFSPLLVARLLPLTEAAIVAQGVRSGPVRTAQSAASLAVSAQMLTAQRSRQLAAGPLAGMGSDPTGGMRLGAPRSGDPSAGAEWRVAGEPWARGRRGGEATTGVTHPPAGERASPPAASTGGVRRVPNRDEPAPPRGSPAAKHSPRPPGGRSSEGGGGDER
jgi:hypothetical protein